MRAAMPPTTHQRKQYRVLVVAVEVRDARDHSLVAAYTTDLANDQMRRVYTEQTMDAYANGQYTTVTPVRTLEAE